MNLQQIKQEAREEFDNLIETRKWVIPSEHRETILDTLIDKVVDAVEASVVPEEREVNYQSPNTFIDLEHNACREDVLEAFRKFRGEKVPCDCPKGGMDSEGRVCTKCDGSEWVEPNFRVV